VLDFSKSASFHFDCKVNRLCLIQTEELLSEISSDRCVFLGKSLGKFLYPAQFIG